MNAKKAKRLRRDLFKDNLVLRNTEPVFIAQWDGFTLNPFGSWFANDVPYFSHWIRTNIENVGKQDYRQAKKG